MGTEVARAHLMLHFGSAGKVSDAWLKRVWAAAGVRYLAAPGGNLGRPVVPVQGTAGSGNEEESEYFPCGAGLALIAAAEAELGCALDLAKCALQLGKRHSGKQVL